jgi:hypothetical protein
LEKPPQERLVEPVQAILPVLHRRSIRRQPIAAGRLRPATRQERAEAKKFRSGHSGLPGSNGRSRLRPRSLNRSGLVLLRRARRSAPDRTRWLTPERSESRKGPRSLGAIGEQPHVQRNDSQEDHGRGRRDFGRCRRGIDGSGHSIRKGRFHRSSTARNFSRASQALLRAHGCMPLRRALAASVDLPWY